MSNNGWTKLGDWDPMHYDYNGTPPLLGPRSLVGAVSSLVFDGGGRTGGVDVRTLSVLAFQKLWNLNNANKLKEDGAYGPATEAALLAYMPPLLACLRHDHTKLTLLLSLTTTARRCLVSPRCRAKLVFGYETHSRAVPKLAPL
jgi:hypothetical protein